MVYDVINILEDILKEYLNKEGQYSDFVNESLYKDLTSMYNDTYLDRLFLKYKLDKESFPFYKKLIILLMSSGYYKDLFFRKYRMNLCNLTDEDNNHFEPIELEILEFLSNPNISIKDILKTFYSGANGFALEVIGAYYQNTDTSDYSKLYNIKCNSFINSNDNLKRQLFKINPYANLNLLENKSISYEEEIMFILKDAYILSCDEYNYNKEEYDLKYTYLYEEECDEFDLEEMDFDNEYVADLIIGKIFIDVLLDYLNNSFNNNIKKKRALWYVIYLVFKSYVYDKLNDTYICHIKLDDKSDDYVQDLKDQLDNMIDLLDLAVNNSNPELVFDDEEFADVFSSHYIEKFSYLPFDIKKYNNETNEYDGNVYMKALEEINPFKK